jgi:HEAT repeat protein
VTEDAPIEGEVLHLEDMEFEGPNLDVPDPPADLAYEAIEDWYSLQILELNGIANTEAALIEALETDSDVLQAAAAHSCWPYPSAEHALLAHTADGEDDNVAVEAAYALARQGHPGSLELLHRFLDRPVGPYLSPVLAAGYLAQRGDPSGFAVVRQGLSNEFRTTRMLACKQLYFFLRYQGQLTPGGDSVDAAGLFELALKDEEPAIRGQALGQLQRSSLPEARSILDRHAAP